METRVDGRLAPALVQIVQSALDRSTRFAHQPKFKMVFISNATNIGTNYAKSELETIYEIWKRPGMLLILGAALTSSKNDLKLKDIHSLTDIFWLQENKSGALLGRVVIIKGRPFRPDARSI